MGIRDRRARLASVARAQDPGVRRVRRLAPSAGRPGGCHARSATVAIVEVARPRISSSWPSALRRAWRMVVGWSARTPVGYGSTGSSGRQPESAAGVRGRNTAAGPGGGAAVVGASVASASVFSAVEPMAAHATDSAELSERRVDADCSARLRALIAALSGSDREIVLLRVVAGCPSRTSWPSWVSPRAWSAWLSTRPWAHCGLRRPPAPYQLASGWCCCHTPEPKPLTPESTTAHRKGPRHEPRRSPAAPSGPG
jgi:hypothetical protein